jgi:hypothetical protein
MDKIFQRIIDNNFSELPGLSVDAFVPVPESLINEMIQVSLRGNKILSYCRVTVGRDNKVSADVRSPLLPWTVHLKMKLFGSVDFTGSPKVRAFLENNVLLGRLGALFKALPEGIKLYDDQVVVDVATFLPPQQMQLLELVRSVDIRTTEGKVLLDIRIEN